METLTTAYISVVRKKAEPCGAADINYTMVVKASQVLRALSHNIRRDIINLLQQNKKLQVTDIYTALGLQQAIASQHLAILRKAKIVTVEYTSHDCRVIYYSLNHARLNEVARMCDFMV